MLAAERKEGLVIRALGGFFFVAVDGCTYRCIVKGTLKKKEEILVGERVTFIRKGSAEGVIDAVLPRHSRLLRPPIANVDKVVVVFSVSEPPPNYMLVDRILVQAEAAGLEIVVCLNKSDLLANVGQAKELLRPYQSAGYRTYYVSSKNRDTVTSIKNELSGCISVLAGQSGVGKSSLLNTIQPGLNLATGKVSRRTGRGRHTTRHVELLPLDGGGWVADTPGFSTLNLPEIEPEELVYLFPELGAVASKCRFPSCRHESEPDCAVRAAVAAGRVTPVRFNSYQVIAQELRELRRKW